MTQKQNRRNFLKQGVITGTEFALCCVCFYGCANSQKGESAEKISKPNKKVNQDFSNLSYCCLRCQECELFIATKNSDNALKAKVAKRWLPKHDKDFKLEDFYCYGCRSETLGYFSKDCTVRKCATEKGVVTCAHCKDFPVCDEEVWTKWPELRKRTDEIRSQLEAKCKASKTL